MSSSPEREPGPSRPSRVPTGALAAGLVLAVAVALVGVNLVGRPSIRLSGERLDALLQQGLVEEVQVYGSRVECILTAPVRLREERQPVERVEVELGVPPGQVEVLRWETAGAVVVRQPQPQVRHWPWGSLVSVLLAGGVWHLICQARRHRHTGGPRQRLQEADQQLAQGALTRQEYDKLISEITVEL